MELHLVISNTEQDLQDHKMMKRVEYFGCRRCGHKWAASLEEMMEDASCRKCRK